MRPRARVWGRGVDGGRGRGGGGGGGPGGGRQTSIQQGQRGEGGGKKNEHAASRARACSSRRPAPRGRSSASRQAARARRGRHVRLPPPCGRTACCRTSPATGSGACPPPSAPCLHLEGARGSGGRGAAVGGRRPRARAPCAGSRVAGPSAGAGPEPLGVSAALAPGPRPLAPARTSRAGGARPPVLDIFETPKSPSFSSPLEVTSTLEGLRSRCRMPLAWVKCRARHTWGRGKGGVAGRWARFMLVITRLRRRDLQHGSATAPHA
jgi:hypothetical protein